VEIDWAPVVHTNAGPDLMISRMGEESHPEPGRAEVAGARSGFAGFSTARLREWLPGMFAARLLAGVRLSSGRMVGETDRVVHLFPIPAGRVVPGELQALCGLLIRPGHPLMRTCSCCACAQL
jgi:hypothetical protein